MLWEQRLGRRELLLDHPAHHHYFLLLRQRMERKQLRVRLWLWLRQRLRVRLLNPAGKAGRKPRFFSDEERTGSELPVIVDLIGHPLGGDLALD